MNILQKFDDLKTIQKIMLLIAVMSFFMASIGYAGYYFLNASNHSVEKMYEDSLMPISQLNRSLARVNALKSNVLEIILLKNNKSQQNELLAEIEKIRSDYTQLLSAYEKTNLNDEEKDGLKEFKQSLDNYKTYNNNILNLALAGKSDEAYRLYIKSKPLYLKYVGALENLAELSQKKAVSLNEENKVNAEKSRNTIILTILAAITISILFGSFIALKIQKILEIVVLKMKEIANGNLDIAAFDKIDKSDLGEICSSFNIMLINLRNLVKEVISSVDEMSSSSEEMSAATEQTAQGAQMQAKSASYCVDNVNSMNGAIQKIYSNAQNTVEISEISRKSVEEGQNKAKFAVEKINQIKNTSAEISQTINELGKLSSEIEIIVELIKNIAGQTNLLALNAAIEAARAGEHGKGFAVVAEEVKKLAGQSAEATDKITSMVKEIQNKTSNAVITMDTGVSQVEEGVSTIENVGQVLHEILNATKETNNRVLEISSEVNNLSSNSDNVVKMAEDISAVTEEQSASLQQISASTISLTKIAENLQKLVSVFKV